MTAQSSLDEEELVYMLRQAHLSPKSLRDLEREVADRQLLKNARVQHQRVQDAAISASQNYELEEETRRIEELSKQERRRVKLAEQRIREQAELDRLRAVPTPSPPPPPPPVPSISQVTKAPTDRTKSIATQTPPLSQVVASIPPPPATQPPPQPPPPAALPAPSQTVSELSQKATTGAAAGPLQQIQSVAQTNPKPQSRTNLEDDRYVQIHQELKKLRKYVIDMGNQEKDRGNGQFRTVVGDLRRAIRAKVGQIKSAKGAVGANRDQITGIMDIMKQALEAPGPRIDPSPYFVRPPPPVHGAPDELPLIFLYIMNLFVKIVIAQFISEAAIKPEAADPIGTVAVNVIARQQHCWRGVSLMDMMIAKYRIVCPVLFGSRGGEKTQQGRKRLGWKADVNGTWVDDQTHNDRMAGLGAGYAAISLRDFSRSTSMTNPFPPTKYWAAMAAIVNTPPAEVSNTQCTVLKAMIDGYEMRFMTFYGSAAVAALKVAVVDFPTRAPEQSSAVTALSFLRSKIQDQFGLRLG